jgi:hypothetical protein
MENRERHVDQQRENPKAAPDETRVTKPTVAEPVSGGTEGSVGHTAVPEAASAQSPEGDDPVQSTVVVTRAQLQQLQQAQQILVHQRELRNARQKRWRDSHLEQARAYDSAWKRKRRSES